MSLLYVIEKFCDFFTLRPSGLITTLTYILMDNFCPCFRLNRSFVLYVVTNFSARGLYLINYIILIVDIFNMFIQIVS